MSTQRRLEEDVPGIDVFQAPIESLVRRHRAEGALLHLEPGLAFQVSRNGEELSFDLLQTVLEAPIRRSDPATISTPIFLDGKRCGSISLSFGHASRIPPQAAQELRETIDQCLANIGAPGTLGQVTTGKSAPSPSHAERPSEIRLKVTQTAVGNLENLLARAAICDAPVILYGEIGTETRRFAKEIHRANCPPSAPFVAVYCGIEQPVDYLEDLRSFYRRARSGTLYLDSVDLLSRQAQGRLLLCLMESTTSSEVKPPRIIASAQRDLHELCQEEHFSNRLLALLDYLPLRIPPLRERKHEFLTLFREQFRKYDAGRDVRLTDEALAALTAHSWPENLQELDRVVARLAVWTTNHRISLEDVQRCGEFLTCTDSEELHLLEPIDSRPPEPGAPLPEPDDCESQRIIFESPCALAQQIVTGQLSFLEFAHEGVRRAVEYLSTHFREPVDMTTLARHSHVSPSHLSALFKITLNTSFKTLLVHLRVEQAKADLAVPSAIRVTDVALEVGFNDVGHFAKVFRRIVGLSPREFRHQTLSQRGRKRPSEALSLR